MDADNESADSESINLPDDVLILLAKDYIRQRDGLSLSLTGNDERFASFYGKNRRSLSIQQCYYLTSLSPDESPWGTFFNQHIDASLISYFNASHLYWFKAEDLCCYIHQMVNLEELYIQGTKIRLGHLPRIFKACPKISKLGFTLSENNLDEYEEGVMEKATLDCLTQGFSRLTHLKIFSFALDATWYDESWLVILGVLKWCRICVDLFIRIGNPKRKARYPYINPSLDDPQFNRIFDTALDLLFHHVIDWMRNYLKSFIVLSYGSPSHLESCVLDRVLSWLGQNHHLERLWLTDEGALDAYSELVMTGSSSPAKSLVVDINRTEHETLVLHLEQFRQLEYLSGFPYRRFDHLSKLTFFRGTCCDTGNDEGLNAFCESHPKLEQLHFDTSEIWRDDEDYVERFGDGDWKLLSLKVLVYRFMGTTFQSGMGQMIRTCPSIEELDVKDKKFGFFVHSSRVRIEMIEFYSSIQFNHLTKLSICEFHLFDGSYLLKIIHQCPKLERIHLKGESIESLLFSNLAECLSSASNLRDLRLVWEKNDPIDASHLQRFGDALRKCSPGLERLVLINKIDKRDGKNPHQMILRPNFLVPCVKEMKRLVCLCLVGFDCDPSEVEKLNQRFTVEILIERPSFWFHVGPKLPEGNDQTVPTVYYDEIVCPIDAFRAPPRF